MIRLTPDPNQSPLDPESLSGVNELIQARIDGRISRRALISRAAKLGIAAPVVGVMLHATSDMAFGAPSNGRAVTLAQLRQDGQPIPITGPVQPSGAQQQGGTITAGTNEEPDTLHPQLSQLVTGSDVYCGIVEPLMKYDSNQQLIPGLAESFTISDDGLTYTYKLRQGVTFHNGEAFTAADVVELWKTIMNPDFGAFSQLGWEKITDIQTPDDYTVVMVTTEAFSPFLSYLSDNGANIPPKSAIAKGLDSFKQEFGRAPIGTGPLKFVEWKAKEQITLDANENYWDGRPLVDRIIYRVVPDDNTLLVQLQTGEIQVAASSGALGALRVDEALKFDAVNVYQHPTLAWNHLDLKHVDHLRITKVRQALDFATPTQQIIDQLLKGRVTRCIADQAPGTWAYNANIQGREYDLEKAAQLLQEAGLTKDGDGWSGPVPAGTPRQSGGEFPTDSEDPNGTLTGPVKPFELEIWGIAGDTGSQQICQIIAQSWNELGVKTEAKFEDVSTLWGPEGYQWNDKMTACLYSWFNSNDPDDMFYWHSSQIPSTPTGSGGNALAFFFKFNFQDKIDELTLAGTKETDQEKRKAIYFQIQELLHEEVPAIFISWGTAFPVVAKDVGGIWPSAFNRLLWDAHHWYLAQ